MKFTDTQITLASNTKIPAETATADKGYTTPSALASLTETLTNKTLSSPIINLGSDATGDVYYRNSTGQFTRLGVGSDGQVLTLTSGIPSWTTPSSGGLTYWTEAKNTSSPNATIPVISFSVTGSETNIDAVLSPKGTGGVAAHIANSATSGGNKRGTNSVDWQSSRSNANQVASGTNATIGGGANNRAEGNSPVISGGSGNIVTGNLGSILGGNNNTVSGAWGAIIGGFSNSVGGSAGVVSGGGSNSASSGDYNTVSGGNGNTASLGGSTVCGGVNNTASGSKSTVSGGEGNTASGNHSLASGLHATTRSIHGCESRSSGRFSINGDCQYGDYILRRQTAGATPVELSTDNNSTSSSNQIVLPNNHAYSFEGKVIARDTTGLYKIWHFTGGISRGANAAATVIGDYTIDPVHASAGTDAWSADFSANTTLGCLTVTVTGEAGKTIRWASHIETIELG